MPDPEPPAPPNPEPPKPPEPTPPVPPAPPDPGDDVEKWKALSRKHEADSKKNADAAKRLAEIENANKSESEKLTEKLSTATTELSTAQANAVRFEVALDKGLTKAQAKRLVGTTREELEADADLLIEELGGERGPKPADRPRERLRGGGDPTVEPDETDPRKLAGLVDRR